MKLSANERLCHNETRDEHPSRFILHMARGGTDFGAHATKALPAGQDLM